MLNNKKLSKLIKVKAIYLEQFFYFVSQINATNLFFNILKILSKSLYLEVTITINEKFIMLTSSETILDINYIFSKV